MTGFLVFNDSLSSQKFDEVHALYVEAGKELGIDIELVSNIDILCVYDVDTLKIEFRNTDKTPDFILFLDKDVRLASQLEAYGYKVFNSSKVVEICDDKNYTYQELVKHGVPIPKTIISKVVFRKNFNWSNNDFIIKEIGFPMVIKESFGSFGQQVYMAKNEEELVALQEKIMDVPHLYQKFIASSSGKDLRIYICDGEYVTSMYRYSEVDFRANMSNGGTAEKYEPNEEFIQIAKDATKAVGANFAGVDLLFGEDGKPVVCEINSNAHIRNVYDCTGVNVGEYILKCILKQLNK